MRRIAAFLVLAVLLTCQQDDDRLSDEEKVNLCFLQIAICDQSCPQSPTHSSCVQNCAAFTCLGTPWSDG